MSDTTAETWESLRHLHTMRELMWLGAAKLVFYLVTGNVVIHNPPVLSR